MYQSSLLLWLLPTFLTLTLSTALSIPINPSSLLPQAQNNDTSPPPLHLPVTTTPWPRAPYRFSIPDEYFPVHLTINVYGAPGPQPRQARPLLSALADNIRRSGGAYDFIGTYTDESVSGVVLKFTEARKGGGGVARLIAERVVRRLAELTREHGAVGVERGDVVLQHTKMAGMELEWRFD